MNKAERKAHQEKMARLHETARCIVATGQCPECGTGLVRNTSLPGWWQCGGYAAPSHRRPEYATVPKCDFQTFTE